VSQVGISGSTVIAAIAPSAANRRPPAISRLATTSPLRRVRGQRRCRINQVMAGFPLQPHREWLKAAMAMTHLPEMRRDCTNFASACRLWNNISPRSRTDMELNTKQIMTYLPIAFPFYCRPDHGVQQREKIVGVKNVTINEPFFQGHFPGHPIMREY